ncbi:hypothetical protein DPO80_22985 [Salmonella enterica subsp. salamae]|nr:hypothetical protein [Salmonella enterica]ECI4153152.1 hypothetical protein [Salmonella enterica subsp. salamae]
MELIIHSLFSPKVISHSSKDILYIIELHNTAIKDEKDKARIYIEIFVFLFMWLPNPMSLIYLTEIFIMLIFLLYPIF